MRYPMRYVIASGFLLAALALGGCCGPSECRPAKEGFARYAPVIQALERYRQEHGAYPPALADLVPAYLPRIDEPESADLRYDRRDAGFDLGFTYYGPGVNNCWYESTRKSWSCSGYY
jgi:hypothetical protein